MMCLCNDILYYLSNSETILYTKYFKYVDMASFNLFILRKEYASREKTLESIIGIITDLFVDWYKLKGRDVRHMIPQVQEVILNGNFDAIVSTIRSAEMRWCIEMNNILWSNKNVIWWILLQLKQALLSFPKLWLVHAWYTR